ncbi:LysR family transcriptional regulator [Pseudomonas lopnurensis]|uniref:LysR family transcriptional regulator n=1 Tax=Pseudomonas lopnurensis TaxID=1477517 RepID=UPI0028B19AA4|nr:LysR family transcriptional regulator [Pseudomonas lopnurensis]
MDQLGALSAFVHAAEARSFTEAGRRLELSSSAIGKAVTRLEERLGVRLFHRSTRAITLTAEGALFLERCHRIFAELEVAERELTQAAGNPQGKLRISLPQLGMRLMPHLIAFQQAYPAVELELDFSDRLVNVIEEGFDAVMRIGEVQDSRLMMRRLNGFSHRLVATPDYLARRGEPTVPADLAAHACLHYRYPSSGKLDAWPLFAGDKCLSLDLPQTAVTNAVDPLLAMAEAGQGIACLPDFIVAEAIEQQRLVPLLDSYIQDQRTLSILWPSSRQPLPKIKAFVDFIAARLASGPG